MSRRTINDNSASVSLFPFLAVLLCTMGALLVVLVAVSRNARSSTRQVDSTTANSAADDPMQQQKLDQIRAYMSRVEEVRAEARLKLREEQLRITQIESHMRDLQQELQKLVYAAEELEALETEHTDDFKQAERERERLHQLIAEKEAAIDQMKQGATHRKRTYSLVPYEGPNGTTRRPLIVECCKEGIVLQPEGVVISRNDLQPPLGSGNALAAALRAARAHHIKQHPEDAQSRDTEPYPMLVIRPEGTELFGLARRAIEAADFDFGYEPVEAHWELNYGTPDPTLAWAEQQAIDQARARQEMLALAAPRAYRDSTLASSGRFESDDSTGGTMGRSMGRGGFPKSSLNFDLPMADEASLAAGHGAGAGAPGEGENYTDDAGTPLKDGRYGEISSGGGSTDSTSAAAGGASSQMAGNAPGGNANEPSGNSQRMPPGARVGQPSGANASSDRSSASQNANGATAGSQSGSALGGSPNDIDFNHQQQIEQNQEVVPNWSRPRPNTRAIAVRRPIRVIVRSDQVGLVSDEARAARSDLTGKTIKFEGDTIESMEEFVKAVEQQVDGWGIAGDNLYWKPILEIRPGPDGEQRAADMVRLLKNSDVEIQLPSTATNIPQGTPNATR